MSCIPDEEAKKINESDLFVIREILSEDPRPSYQSDPDRIYHMDYAHYAIDFYVADGLLTVTQVTINERKKER